MVHAEVNASNGGNQRLKIGVEADDCRAQMFLSNRNQEIGDEGGKQDEETQLKAIVGGHGAEVDVCHLLDVQRNGHEHREQKHPLHESNDIVFCDERTENAQITSEKQAVEYHQNDA